MRLVIFLFGMFISLQGFGWGFWAHQRINRMAVFTLPGDMLILYKRHIEFITSHAVDPDMRRYAVEGEAPRHYIDLDRYGSFPYPNIPRTWKAAVEALSEDTLMAHGIVPYELPRQVWRLKEAFEAKDLRRILKISADLGHYVGDAHVPLHTTRNYNGQLTGQRGIHGFWESRIPELFAEQQYDFFVGRCFYIDSLGMASWNIVLASNLAVDSVLVFDRALSANFPEDRKFGYESRNNVVTRSYSREYSLAYQQMLGGMVERRMRSAIRMVGSYWYTAWVLAGSPDLRELAKQEIEEELEPFPIRLKIQDREAQDLGCCTPGTGCDAPVNYASLVHAVRKPPIMNVATPPKTAKPGYWEVAWALLNTYWI